MATNLRLLKEIAGYKKVCYPHAKAMGGHVGLKVKKLNYLQLTERLLYIYKNRLEIRKLKTAKETFTWFRVKNRPARASNALRPYKFLHSELLAGAAYD